MQPYLLRNNDRQHKERQFLERWYETQRKRRVYYYDILHDLQSEKVRQIQEAGE